MATDKLEIDSCPDCGAIYSMMEVGGVTDWGCTNSFHSRGRKPVATDKLREIAEQLWRQTVENDTQTVEALERAMRLAIEATREHYGVRHVRPECESCENDIVARMELLKAESKK